MNAATRFPAHVPVLAGTFNFERLIAALLAGLKGDLLASAASSSVHCRSNSHATWTHALPGGQPGRGRQQLQLDAEVARAPF